MNSQFLNKINFQYNYIIGKEFSENYKNSNYKLYKSSDNKKYIRSKDEYKKDAEKNYVLKDNTVGRNNFSSNKEDVGKVEIEGLVKVEKSVISLKGDSKDIELSENITPKPVENDDDKIEEYNKPDLTSEYYQNKTKLNLWRNDLKNFNRLKDSQIVRENKEEDVQKHNKYKFEDNIKVIYAIANKKSKRKRMIINEIYKYDSVYIFRGEFKGKSGKVLSVNYNKKTIRIEGINVKEMYPNESRLLDIFNNENGKDMSYTEKIKISKLSQPIDLDDVRLISPHCNKTIKPIFEENKAKNKNDGSLIRMCPETNKIINFPGRQKAKNPYKKFESITDHENETSVENIETITFKGYDYESVFESFLNRQKVLNERKSELILKDKVSANLIKYNL